MSIRCLVTPKQALYRVFVQPSLLPCSNLLVPQAQLSPRFCLAQQKAHSPNLAPRRCIYVYAKTTPTGIPKSERKVRYDPSILLDERIGSLTAHLVASDNKLGPLTPLSQLLRNVDRETSHLRKVGETPTGAPIVREVTKEALRDEAIAKSKVKAEKGKTKSEEASTKQVELTWAIGENDLGYRIAWMENFLREGRRVEVLIAPKKGGRVAMRDEVLELLRSVRTAAKAVEGTKEWKGMEGMPGAQVTLHFQNEEQKQVVQEEKKVKAGEARVEKLERKAKEKEEAREKQERRLQKKKEAEAEKEKLRAAQR